MKRIQIVLEGFSHRLDDSPNRQDRMPLRSLLIFYIGKGHARNLGRFLRGISSGYNDLLQNNGCVCKEMPTLMAKGTLSNGRILHTSNMLKHGGHSLGMAEQ
jgi:hypothetical protein